MNDLNQVPRIVVIGEKSSGKSSVLERIIGFNMLPKGSGSCTRRPLELRLHNLPEGWKPWAKFKEVPNL